VVVKKPLAKKRKINGTAADEPVSFADTLKKLQDEAVATGKTGNGDEQWPRPAVDRFDPEIDDLTFQQIDIEEANASGQTPAIRIYGVTAKGNSVLVHVHGFRPYFYIHAPRNFGPSHCREFQNHLNTLFGQRVVQELELCSKRSLMNYSGEDAVAFIKITISDPRNLPKVRGSLERGEVAFKDLFKSGESLLTYENIAYTLRFMIDLKVSVIGTALSSSSRLTSSLPPLDRRDELAMHQGGQL
jgi:DNA polymerase delta subunit 1